MITIIFSILCVVYVVSEFATIAVYKYPIRTDNDVIESIEKYRVDGCSLNPYDKNIIYVGKNREIPYIAKIPFSLLFTYHINGLGTIPFWYKSHRVIKSIHNELLKEKTNRKDLGLDD